MFLQVRSFITYSKLYVTVLPRLRILMWAICEQISFTQAIPQLFHRAGLRSEPIQKRGSSSKAADFVHLDILDLCFVLSLGWTVGVFPLRAADFVPQWVSLSVLRCGIRPPGLPRSSIASCCQHQRALSSCLVLFLFYEKWLPFSHPAT